MKYVYRIIDALLAAAVFTNLLFTDLIFFQASTTLFDAGLEESVNLKKIIDILSGNDSLSGLLPEAGSFKWPAAFDPINGRLIACGVAIALALQNSLGNFASVYYCMVNLQQQKNSRCCRKRLRHCRNNRYDLLLQLCRI